MDKITDLHHRLPLNVIAKNAGLVFITNTNEYSGGVNNVWVAWNADPTKRERVVWRSIQIEGEPEAKNRWVSIEDDASVWNGYEFQRVVLLRR